MADEHSNFLEFSNRDADGAVIATIRSEKQTDLSAVIHDPYTALTDLAARSGLHVQILTPVEGHPAGAQRVEATPEGYKPVE